MTRGDGICNRPRPNQFIANLTEIMDVSEIILKIGEHFLISVGIHANNSSTRVGWTA